jgi:GNAT superfamily N-acetyltransferase
MEKHNIEDQNLEKDDMELVVRHVKPSDLDAIIRIDAKTSGEARPEFFRRKFEAIEADSNVAMSLVAEHDGRVAGFLLARVHFGEFGRLQQSAVLDTLGVDPVLSGRGVGRRLLRQLVQNVRGLRIPTLSTEVSWSDQRLMSFFEREGFILSQRVCLDLPIE